MRSMKLEKKEGSSQEKLRLFEEIGLTPISQTGYILNIDGFRNREEIFEH